MTADCCFPKGNRLSKPSEFSTVYQHNQIRVKGQYFIVLAFSRFQTVANDSAGDRISPEFNNARVGVVVSKKVSKSAVRRNRVKRLARERYRCLSHPDGFDFVVIAKPAANTATNLQITKELGYLWRKLHQRCAAS